MPRGQYRDKEKQRAKWRRAGLRRSFLNNAMRRERGVRAHRELKRTVLGHYGVEGKPMCVRCSITDLDVLTLDHINDNGAKERRELGIRTGGHFYRYLAKRGLPTGYQTLCSNCNLKKRVMASAKFNTRPLPPKEQNVLRLFA